MPAIQEGRVCLKKTGRDAGKKCVVTKDLGKGFFEVLSSGRKKARKCNSRHLEALNETVDAGNQDEVKKALAG